MPIRAMASSTLLPVGNQVALPPLDQTLSRNGRSVLGRPAPLHHQNTNRFSSVVGQLTSLRNFSSRRSLFTTRNRIGYACGSLAIAVQNEFSDVFTPLYLTAIAGPQGACTVMLAKDITCSVVEPLATVLSLRPGRGLAAGAITRRILLAVPLILVTMLMLHCSWIPISTPMLTVYLCCLGGAYEVGAAVFAGVLHGML